MQTINVFIRADSAKGTLVDSYNSTTNSLPTIIRRTCTFTSSSRKD